MFPPKRMHANILLDITVESSIRDDPLLAQIAELVLELSSNGNVVDTVNLVSKQTTSGVWNTEQPLIM
jgi:hypothetical protein